MQHKNTPHLVKGTRDFDFLQVAKRNYVFDKIRTVYQQYGFTPLETPALEHLSTLLGHYGHEGDQLIFKILNSGNFLADVPPECTDYKKLGAYLTEKGLRYDLTVPLMRYVATHYQSLTFPYKRYQIQPVWRADRPQQGRYREFYQCDADVIGASSLLCEAEMLTMAHQLLQNLGITEFTIFLNHRLVLHGITELMGTTERASEFCITIDKLDKMGHENVIAELINKGFSAESLANIGFIFDSQHAGNWLAILHNHFQSNAKGLAGLQAIQELLKQVDYLTGGTHRIQLDPTLARGLSYYTGTVFEIKLPSFAFGSIGGGGRYDNFADHFGVAGLTGVGLSFGIDRLYLALEALHLLPEITQLSTQVMFTNLDKEAESMSLPFVTSCRQQGISTEIYPEQAPLKKQLAYANKKSIPLVVILGEEERYLGKWLVKDMQTGLQTRYKPAQLVAHLKHSCQTAINPHLDPP